MAKIIESTLKTTRMSRETGEIIEETEKTERLLNTNTKYNYSMWIGDNKMVKDLSSVQICCLLALSTSVEYETGIITLTADRREKLASELGIKLRSLINVLSQLNKKGKIRSQGYGTYQISPFLFHRGQLTNIRPLQDNYLKCT